MLHVWVFIIFSNKLKVCCFFNLIHLPDKFNNCISILQMEIIVGIYVFFQKYLVDDAETIWSNISADIKRYFVGYFPGSGLEIEE